MYRVPLDIREVWHVSGQHRTRPRSEPRGARHAVGVELHQLQPNGVLESVLLAACARLRPAVVPCEREQHAAVARPVRGRCGVGQGVS